MAVVENASAESTLHGDDHQNNNTTKTRMVDPTSALYIKVHPFHNDPPSQNNNATDQFKREMRELEDMFTKLNPMAAEFVPPSLSHTHRTPAPRKKNNYVQGKRRMNSRTSMAQREDAIRRTVYVSEVDQQITEEQLAALFLTCGQVVDCRICGDPKSVLRFAFVEFTNEEGAQTALNLSGTMLGYYPLRVLPSKTAIAPVNTTLLPRSEDEREMCARTVYCTNIDRMITQADVKLFFESFCGEVCRLRLLGDHRHPTCIAFVEFAMVDINSSSLVFYFLYESPVQITCLLQVKTQFEGFIQLNYD